MSHCIFMSRLSYCLDVAVQVAVKNKIRAALDRTLPRRQADNAVGAKSTAR